MKVQANMRLNNFVEETLKNKIESREAFIEDIRQIAGMVELTNGLSENI
jgi:hypothetical protein